MSKVITISVLFACDRQIDLKTYKKIRRLEQFLVSFNFAYYTTPNAIKNVDDTTLLKNFKILELSGAFFDFSRYEEFLKYPSGSTIAILVNDTLGSGRKFNTGLWLHIMISILLIRFGFYELSGPFDRDENRGWLSPYLVLGKIDVLKNLKWTDWESAKKNLLEPELVNIEKWLDHKWRSRKISDKSQRDVKRKILYVERMLLCSNIKKYKILRFSKRNPLRWLNSVNI